MNESPIPALAKAAKKYLDLRRGIVPSAEAPPEPQAQSARCSVADLFGAQDCRLRFVKSLHGLGHIERTRLLSIETDDEISALITVALEAQWFEVAAGLKHEMKRRGREMVVSSPNAASETRGPLAPNAENGQSPRCL